MNRKSRKYTRFIQTILFAAILIFVNLLGSTFYTYLDLTEDKRFTLDKSTVALLEDVDDNIFVEVLLEGNLTAGLTNLKDRTTEVLNQFNNLNSSIDYVYIDPNEGSVEEINTVKRNLQIDGILPQTLFIFENDKQVQKQIYPYAIVKYGKRRIPVNLLEPKGRDESEDAAITESMSMLEYKLASAIQQVYRTERPIVAFLEGHGELADFQTAKLEMELGYAKEVVRINLDSTYQVDPFIDVLIIAGPKTAIGLKDQFKIDQYIMNGGKVIWLVDQFFVNLDSINYNKIYVPKKRETGIEPMLFKYGLRINPDLVLDVENTKIPQVVGRQGGKEQERLFGWVYHPLLQGSPESNITKNIDRVSATFPSSIDLLPGNENVSITPLLTSSEYSRRQVYPMRLSFDVLKVEQKNEAYNKSNLPVAVLLEGTFESNFKNRVSEEMQKGLDQLNLEFKPKSDRTSQIVVTDSDIIKNLYDAANNRISPIGFNKWTNQTFAGNRDFIVNAIEYLVDDYGLIEARSKNMKMRILDQVELTDHKTKWQVINLLIPSLIVLVFGLLYRVYRRRKYA